MDKFAIFKKLKISKLCCAFFFVLIAILFALIVVGIFRTWGYAPYKVPTGSMLQTIQRGDFLFANMHSYGFIIPFTDKKIFKSAVKRQDIVIFPYPQDPSVNFIKRVIGLPGDKISIRNEIVFINDRQLDEPYKFLDTGFFAGRELEITENCASRKILYDGR